MKIYEHNLHPHEEFKKRHAPKPKAPSQGPVARFNDFLGETITKAVGTMWCAYVFAIIALISLPEAIKAGRGALIAWIAQTFLQLVLLSIIMVGQKVGSAAADTRSEETYKDAEAILHEALEIQQHLQAQDEILQKLIANYEKDVKEAKDAKA
jgi:uncharacterized membrane protein